MLLGECSRVGGVIKEPLICLGDGGGGNDSTELVNKSCWGYQLNEWWLSIELWHGKGDMEEKKKEEG